MNVLVIAPHPDDEVLGCGGVIAKHIHNQDLVSVCYVTAAYTPEWSAEYLQNRQQEIQNLAQHYQLHQQFSLEFPTVKLDTIPQKDLNDALSRVIQQAQPDILYIPHHGDINKDHRLVAEAALVASRPLHTSISKILAYEVLSETEWGNMLLPFVPNVFVDISEFLESKLTAMSIYQSELCAPPHPRSLPIIQTLAAKRGSEVGYDFAEAFVLIRSKE